MNKKRLTLHRGCVLLGFLGITINRIFRYASYWYWSRMAHHQVDHVTFVVLRPSKLRKYAQKDERPMPRDLVQLKHGDLVMRMERASSVI